jgi:hypothetical protein
VAYHASVLGEGYPTQWPQGWIAPITLTPVKLDPNDAPYQITGAGIRRLRRQLLAAFDDGTSNGTVAAAGEEGDGELSGAQEVEAERLVLARRSLLERREKAGHTLVQWKIDVDFAEVRGVPALPCRVRACVHIRAYVYVRACVHIRACARARARPIDTEPNTRRSWCKEGSLPTCFLFPFSSRSLSLPVLPPPRYARRRRALCSIVCLHFLREV